MNPEQRLPARAEAFSVEPNGLAPDAVPYVVETHPDHPDLVQRWEVVRRHIPHLLFAIALGAGIAWLRRGDQTPIYRASTTVRFHDTRASLTSGFGNQPDAYYRWDPVAAQMELLKTRATRERAVDSAALQVRSLPPADISWLARIDAARVTTMDTLRLSFDSSQVTARFGGRTATAPYGATLALNGLSLEVPSRPPANAAAFAVTSREEAIGEVSGVNAVTREESDIADLSFSGRDPVFVQRALNAMTLALEAVSKSSEQQSARERRTFLDEQLRRTDSTLEDRRAQLSAFRARSQTFDATQKVSQEQLNLANLKSRREELAADRQVFASLLAGAMSARAAGDPTRLRSLISAPGITNNTLIPELYSQLQKLSLSRDSLTKGPFASTLTNPDVLRLNTQIESVTDAFISAVRSAISTFDARIAALDGLAARSAEEVSSLPATQAEQERLMQDEQSTQRVADQLHDEQQRARISEVAQAGKIEVIDLASTPRSPIPRSSKRMIILGSLIGLLAGAGLIFLFEELDTSLRRKTDIERLLSLPTLGSIPSLSRAAANGKRHLFRKYTGTAKANKNAIVPLASSPVFESYRSIRTSLIFSNAVESLRVVAITSASPGDGKSTTVANLAIAFAQQNLRVLAVDCDLRRGTLHRIFNVPRVPGFTNAIAAGADLSSVIRETTIPNLSLITTGVQPPNPGELLGSARVRELLLEAESRFDLVIIDTPPVLAAADAAIISSMVDGVILLIHVGVTTRSAATAARERLRQVGARILGTVLNDPKEKLEATEQYYYYNYSSSEAQA
ncbi:MAG TPA: polysaccharide biosynthesis tyrosine autokinase [Gemmatimonadaceae bacterium]|nr:polysaccharide biosynthesis tyrosine autokinase [Gemmatimonadaceae bacterium]